MKIFETYTGNAMLNNALMTIEALAKLKNVSEITPAILLELYEKQNLKAINKRLKSYYMLFLNNPLVNKPHIGEKIYDSIINKIILQCDFDGNHVCEISGLKFEKTFDFFYCTEIEKIKEAVIAQNLEKKQLKKELDKLNDTDLTINRGWFPLIGGLGSDAQALPQAKFTIQIHPICIAIMQFLPLSALLYKGGVLLIDSSNFDFSREFIANNVKELQKRIQTAKTTESIENVKDFAKGNYLLKAIEILGEKEIEDSYSDLNLWSFSNSGTGASCEIDRVPNSLIQKLMRMSAKSKIKDELTKILSNKESSYSFLECLESNVEWWLLYPNVFKKVYYEGVSIIFLETYFSEIGSHQKIGYAKYLAYLIDKYKSKSFEKYLGKTDTHNEKEYKYDLYTVLLEATKNGEWDLSHHIQILDNPSQIPIKNNYYNIHKITHFYYQKAVFNSQLPTILDKNNEVLEVCQWLIALIQRDDKSTKISKELANNQDYNNVGYADLFVRASGSFSLDLTTIIYALYDEDFNISKYGLNELLHIFFNQPMQEIFDIKDLEKPKNWLLDSSSEIWLQQFQGFAKDYQAYYFDKYENKQTGRKPFDKFLNQIMEMPNENSGFKKWFDEAIEKTNQFLKAEEINTPDKWSDDLLYSPQGEFTIHFSKLALKFSLMKQYYQSLSNSTQNTNL